MPSTLVAMPMVGPFTMNENGVERVPAVPDDILGDENTGTYIDIDQYLAPPNVFLSSIAGVLQPVGPPITNSRAVVYARFQADGPIQNINLVLPGSGNSSAMDPTGTVLESALGTLYPMDTNGLTLVNNALNGFVVHMSVTVPSSAGHVMRRISEAWIVVALPSGDAPPCRIFPRRDGLGVGAGVAYPPPRSQQRSPGNRGVGYY